MSDHGTFGNFVYDKFPIFCILEPPDKNNQRDISCIPEGAYICKRYMSPKFGETFKVMDVPNRGDIVFHWGNWTCDTKGCLLTGKRFAELNSKPAVADSRLAHKEFMEFFEDDNEFALTVQNSYLYGAINKPPVPINKYP